MSTRPDLAGVLAEHAGCVANGGAWRTGSADTGVDVWSCGIELPFVDDLDDMERAHLAAALHAAIVAWLADQGTREAVAHALEQPVHAPMGDHDPRDGSCRSCPWPLHMVESPGEMARAALAALTTPTTTEDHR